MLSKRYFTRRGEGMNWLELKEYLVAYVATNRIQGDLWNEDTVLRFRSIGCR